MTRRTRIEISLFALFLVGAFAAVAYICTRGFSARMPPTALEGWVARHLRRMAMPASARDAVNPVPPSTSLLDEARAHFADHCASCHANDGSGSTTLGQGLYPPAPDMRAPATQSLTDGELFYVIHNGIRFTGMPAWGDGPVDKDIDSWKLVHFIRRLPLLTKGDVEQMQQMNPRSPMEMTEQKDEENFLDGDSVSTDEPIKLPPPSTGHHH